MNYGITECEIMDDGKPPPRTGGTFVSIHSGVTRPGDANQRNLYELYDFSATLTMRLVVPLDRVGDQQIARNLARVPLGVRQGFNSKVEQLRAYLHSNWQITVLTGQIPNSANDNLAAWSTGIVYGFVEPARYQGSEIVSLVGDEWFGDDPGGVNSEPFTGIKAELKFAGAKRFQPQTAAIGPFV